MLSDKNNPQQTLRLIKSIFNEKVSNYVNKKNIGGESNQKGNMYEDIFAATCISKAAKQYLVNEVNPFFDSQVLGFVDDFMITNDGATNQKAFQLKNSSNVSWKSSKNFSIEDDFLMQHELSKHQGFDEIKLSLVVSDKDTVNKLTPPPLSIASFSSVMHFPYEDAIHRLISDHQELRDDFGFLAIHENFSTVDCEQVAQALIGAWIINGRSGDLVSIIDRARRVSPTVIRPFRTDAEAMESLRPQTKTILDNINDFTYSIVRGFLVWSAYGTSGRLPYDCFDNRFINFQQLLCERSPQTFDEIEGWLL